MKRTAVVISLMIAFFLGGCDSLDNNDLKEDLNRKEQASPLKEPPKDKLQQIITYPVYQDQISNGWTDGSDGVTNNFSSTYKKIGSYSVQSFSLSSSGHLSFYHTFEYETDNVDVIKFWVASVTGQMPDQGAKIDLLNRFAVSFGSVSLLDYVPAGCDIGTTFCEVEIPLSDLNAVDSKVGIVSFKGGKIGVLLYVDELRFESTESDDGDTGDDGDDDDGDNSNSSTEFIVYGDDLGGKVNDFSSAVTIDYFSSVSKNGVSSLRAEYQSASSVFWLRHTDGIPVLYDGVLSMWLKSEPGKSGTGATLEIKTSDGEIRTKPFFDYLPSPASLIENDWYKVDIPLDDFDASNKTVEYFKVQYAGGGTVFYFDDVIISWNESPADGPVDVGNGPESIYKDGNSPDWDLWNYGTEYEYSDSSDPLFGEYALRVDYTASAGSWGGPNFAIYEGFTPSAFNAFTFSIKGPQAIEDFNFIMIDDNDVSVVAQKLNSLGPIIPDQWNTFTLSLADLGISNTTIKRIDISSNVPIDGVLFDNIEFVNADLPDEVTTGSETIYADGLVNGWASWSYGIDLNVFSAGNTASGEYSLEADYSFGVWGGLYLANYEGYNIADKTGLQFSIYGASGVEDLYLQSKNQDGSVTLSSNRLGDVSTIENGVWNTVSIPLSTFNIENAIAHGFILTTDQGLQGVSVDDVKFIDTPIDNDNPTDVGSGPETVYRDGLNSAWSSWSYSVEFNESNSSNPASGVNALEVDYSFGIWGGAYLANYNGLDVSNLTALQFSIFGFEGAEDLYLQSKNQDGSTTLSSTQLGSLVSIENGVWNTVTVPLSILNIENNIAHGIIFTTDQGYQDVLFDDIDFLDVGDICGSQAIQGTALQTKKGTRRYSTNAVDLTCDESFSPIVLSSSGLGGTWTYSNWNSTVSADFDLSAIDPHLTIATTEAWGGITFTTTEPFASENLTHIKLTIKSVSPSFVYLWLNENNITQPYTPLSQDNLNNFLRNEANASDWTDVVIPIENLLSDLDINDPESKDRELVEFSIQLGLPNSEFSIKRIEFGSENIRLDTPKFFLFGLSTADDKGQNDNGLYYQTSDFGEVWQEKYCQILNANTGEFEDDESNPYYHVAVDWGGTDHFNQAVRSPISGEIILSKEDKSGPWGFYIVIKGKGKLLGDGQELANGQKLEEGVSYYYGVSILHLDRLVPFGKVNRGQFLANLDDIKNSAGSYIDHYHFSTWFSESEPVTDSEKQNLAWGSLPVSTCSTSSDSRPLYQHWFVTPWQFDYSQWGVESWNYKPVN